MEGTGRPCVSVIMAVRNGERHLGESIESLMKQTFSDFELVVIDDASTDCTPTLLETFAAADNRLSILRNSSHLGLSQSLNRGLEIARGRYIARMDADDISRPDRLERQVSFMNAEPAIGLLGSGVELIDVDGNVRSVRQYALDPIVIAWRLCFENPLAHPSVMIRSELLRQANGYNPELETSQDYDLWCRLSGSTRLANLPDALVRLRKHSGSLTYRQGFKQRQDSLQISQRYLECLLGRSIQREDVQALWQRPTSNLQDAQLSAELTGKAAQAILARSSWNLEERCLLRSRASRRMLELTRGFRSQYPVWPVIAEAMGMNAFGRLSAILRTRQSS